MHDPGSLRLDQRSGHERVLLQLWIEHEAVVVVEATAGRVRRICTRRRQDDRPTRATEPGVEAGARVQVARIAGRRAGAGPPRQRLQLRGGQAPPVAPDDRSRVPAGHPRRHLTRLGHSHDPGGVGLRVGCHRQRKRRDAAQTVARSAFRVENRGDVAVVRRPAGRRAAGTGDERGGGEQGDCGQKQSLAHPGRS